ncbi:MAG: hypothetical protein DRP87_12315 [Spirochaetes bacterium]|nr:MAG: hypothetical protein DRP87_12315 [Spirochaetota bacterium]
MKQLITLFIALCFLGCNAIVGLEKSSLVLFLSTQEGVVRTITPEADLSVSYYEIEGDGPERRGFSFQTNEQIAEIKGLKAGNWKITARGYNSGKTPVFQGEKEVVLKYRERADIHMILYPVEGKGELEISVNWPETCLTEPVVTGELVSENDEKTELQFQVSSMQAQTSVERLQSGYYTLILNLYDGAQHVAGLAEVVRILAEHTTQAHLDLDTSGSVGAVFKLIVQIDHLEPIAISLKGSGKAVFREDRLESIAKAINTVGNTSFFWYINGKAELEGPYLSVSSDTLPPVNRIDIVAISEEGRAGSEHRIVQIVDPLLCGRVAFLTAFFDREEGVDGLSGARDVECFPDGNMVMVAGYGDNGIAVFNRDVQTGGVHFRECLKSLESIPLGGVIALAASPVGSLLVTASYKDNALNFFRKNDEEGKLDWIRAIGHTDENFEGLEGVYDVAFSPEGAHLYAVGAKANSILIISLDGETGIPVDVKTIFAEGDLSSLLLEPVRVHLSPDGEHVYVACRESDTLIVFSRNLDTGELEFSYSFTDGVGGVDGLNAPSGIALSSGGEHLYITGYYDNSVTLFVRDRVSGNFIWTAIWKDGVGGVDGLYYAQDVAVSWDGEEVYATGGGDDSVSVFSRDGVTGMLTFIGTITDGINGVDGLDSARRIALSPEGKDVFIAGAEDNALVILRQP